MTLFDNDSYDMMWTEATRDHLAEFRERQVIEARLKVARVWPFLAAAKDAKEYGLRKAIAAADIDSDVAEVTGGFEGDFPSLRAEVEASLDADFATLHASRQTARETLAVSAALQKTARQFTHQGEDYYTGIVGRGGSPSGPASCEVCGRPVDNEEAYVTSYSPEGQKVVCRGCGNELNKQDGGTTASRRTAEADWTTVTVDADSLDAAVSKVKADHPDAKIGQQRKVGDGKVEVKYLNKSAKTAAEARCACARNSDGTTTTMLCPKHASEDPCATMAAVTGGRRAGSVVRGTCTNCGWSSKKTSSRHTAKDGDTATCGVEGCGRPIQQMDYAWYHLRQPGDPAVEPPGAHNPHPSPHKENDLDPYAQRMLDEQAEDDARRTGSKTAADDDDKDAPPPPPAGDPTAPTLAPADPAMVDPAAAAGPAMTSGAPAGIDGPPMNPDYAAYVALCAAAGTEPLPPDQWEAQGQPQGPQEPAAGDPTGDPDGLGQADLAPDVTAELPQTDGDDVTDHFASLGSVVKAFIEEEDLEADGVDAVPFSDAATAALHTEAAEELRPIHRIADDISKVWGRQPNGVHYTARPYLDAMRHLQSASDNYGEDSGRSVLAYFLGNASTFRGPEAKALKDELKAHLKQKRSSLQTEAEYKYVHKRGDKWVVTQKGTGDVLSTHDSEEDAKASFRAMMQAKHGSFAEVVAGLDIFADLDDMARAAARIDTLRAIVDQHKNVSTDEPVNNMIDGLLVDPQTANMLVTVHDALGPENQAKFDSIPLPKLVDFGWKQVKSGALQTTASDVACPDCHGTGVQTVDHPGMDYSQPCGTCGGTGLVPPDTWGGGEGGQKYQAASRRTAVDEDGTEYGAWGDHCPHCGNDWKQPHDPDCLRVTDPRRAAELEAAADRINNPQLYRDTPTRDPESPEAYKARGGQSWESWMSASLKTGADEVPEGEETDLEAEGRRMLPGLKHLSPISHISCRKCIGGKNLDRTQCEYCDGRGRLDMTMAVIKNADGFDQGITTTAFKREAWMDYPTVARTVPTLHGHHVVLTYNDDYGVNTISGPMTVQGNHAVVVSPSNRQAAIPMHEILDIRASATDPPPSIPDVPQQQTRDHGNVVDYFAHGLLPSSTTMASRKTASQGDAHLIEKEPGQWHWRYYYPDNSENPAASGGPFPSSDAAMGDCNQMYSPSQVSTFAYPPTDMFGHPVASKQAAAPNFDPSYRQDFLPGSNPYMQQMQDSMAAPTPAAPPVAPQSPVVPEPDSSYGMTPQDQTPRTTRPRATPSSGGAGVTQGFSALVTAQDEFMQPPSRQDAFKEKVTQIAEDVMSNNPGMPPPTAMIVAQTVVASFPEMAGPR